MEVLTRQAQDDLGTSLRLEGGIVTDQEEAGCPAGTTLLIRDLFYNTPARLKFMKKDTAEAAACLAAVQRQAMAHPEVSFKFIKDGKQELLTPGDGQLRSALYAVLGRDMALGFTAVEGSGEDMSVSGFASLPTCCRGTRGYQFFFVNGRHIKSATMTAALEQAYANQRMVGKFPGCVLHLTTKLNAVDVNVHPTKQEVKFGNERQVFSAVYYAVLAALGADQTHPTAVVGTVRSQPREEISYQQTSLPLHDFTAPKTSVEPAMLRMEAKAEVPSYPGARETIPEERKPEAALSGPAPRHWEETGPARPVSPVPAPAERAEEQTPEPLPAEETPLPWRVAGELFHTYIIVEQGDKAFLIDKHAAHERMNFDRMRAEDYVPMSQTLLSPVVFTPAPEEAAVLLDHLEELERVGFQVEDFGGGSLVVRRVPDYVEVGDIEASLTEIAGKRALTGSTGVRERRDEILHTVACKAAIKGGWKSAPEELERVAQAILSGQVKYCPHGRPVAIELTRGQLEKQFKRT